MKKEEDIPFKNYILLAVILIISIFLVIYFYMWYSTYEDERLGTSVMDKYLAVINYNELDNYLIENKDAIIYISVLNDDKVRNFEKQFGNFVNNNLLEENILYMDLTKVINDGETFYKIKRNYGIEELPCVVIFDNGEVSNIYDISKDNYDVRKLSNFLKENGVIND